MSDVEVTIKIPEKVYKYIQVTGAISALDIQQVANAIFDGVLSPNTDKYDGKTNGDMIKALFPNAEFDNAMPFTDGRWETIELDTENKTKATYKPTRLRTYAEWWNAPYKAKNEVKKEKTDVNKEKEDSDIEEER